MNTLNLLHISNDFSNSSNYKQLAIHLDQIGVKQTIYSAVRTEQETRFASSHLDHLDIFIKNILNPHDRILFRLKIRKIYNDLLNRIDPSKINIIHAHTLYSDGAVALKISKQFGTPYIVSVRNSDINAFNKYRPDLIWRRNEVLKEARKVIFVSPAYRQKLLSLLSNSLSEEVERKSVVIPNGIHPEFLITPSNLDLYDKSQLKLLFVGRFLKLKNIPNIIEAVRILNEKRQVTLTLVGSGKKEEELLNLIKTNNYTFINFLGRVNDKQKLLKIYQSHDIFLMISKPETFGLVYIEALSQGLPIVHTEGEGVDGYFRKGTVSESVKNPDNVDEIVKKIEILAERLDSSLREKCINEATQFDWAKIALKYKNLFDHIDS